MFYAFCVAFCELHPFLFLFLFHFPFSLLLPFVLFVTLDLAPSGHVSEHLGEDCSACDFMPRIPLYSINLYI